MCGPLYEETQIPLTQECYVPSLVETGVVVLEQNIFEFNWIYFVIMLYVTRLKPVEHGYVFSMAVGTIGEWLKLVPFL